jgi:hypothetical protein
MDRVVDFVTSLENRSQRSDPYTSTTLCASVSSVFIVFILSCERAGS